MLSRMTTPAPRSARFPKRLRLLRPREFRAVYDAGTRHPVPPLLVWSRPNGLDHLRLGLAISRRAGGAVKRNALKRRLREAFRLVRPELPGGYDLTVSAKAHTLLPVDDYQDLLRRAIGDAERVWRLRDERRRREVRP